MELWRHAARVAIYRYGVLETWRLDVDVATGISRALEHMRRAIGVAMWRHGRIEV